MSRLVNYINSWMRTLPSDFKPNDDTAQRVKIMIEERMFDDPKGQKKLSTTFEQYVNVYIYINYLTLEP